MGGFFLAVAGSPRCHGHLFTPKHGGIHSRTSSPPAQIPLKFHPHSLLDFSGQIQPHDLATQMVRNVAIWLANQWPRGEEGSRY